MTRAITITIPNKYQISNKAHHITELDKQNKDVLEHKYVPSHDSCFLELLRLIVSSEKWDDCDAWGDQGKLVEPADKIEKGLKAI